MPGSYVTSNSMSAPSNALPRFLTLCANSKLPLYLGCFEFAHNVRKRGKALLGALMELLVTYDPGIQYEPDLDGRLVHPPTRPHRALPAMKHRFQQGTVLHDPALDGRVVDGNTSFLHQLFTMAIARRVRHRPPDAHEHDVLRTMGAREADHLCSPSLVQSRWQRKI